MQDRNVQFPQRYKLQKVVGTDDIYDLIPTPGEISSEGTFLNKANLLKDVTASIFGLGSEAVPDDVFSWLGKYNLHWWKRTAQEIATKYRYAQTQEGGQITVYYEKCLCSDSVVLNEDTGVLELVNPTPVYTYADFISHPYCKSTGEGIYINAGGNYSYNETDVFYCPNKPNNSGSGWVRYDSNNPVYKLVVTSYEVAVGESEFVHSSDRNAYPDGGISGSFEYAYLGIPFDNAVTAPAIETGSYVGTGTYGQGNPNSLTFGFMPKVVLIHYGGNMYWVVFVRGFDNVLSTTTAPLGNTLVFSFAGNTLSWYATDAQGNQLNLHNQTYRYLAIG